MYIHTHTHTCVTRYTNVIQWRRLRGYERVPKDRRSQHGYSEWAMGGPVHIFLFFEIRKGPTSVSSNCGKKNAYDRYFAVSSLKYFTREFYRVGFFPRTFRPVDGKVARSSVSTDWRGGYTSLCPLDGGRGANPRAIPCHCTP